MTQVSPPPKFPPFIFLLSDHETIELACDVAKALEGIDPELTAWNFMEPVHDAIGAFVDDTWGGDLGDPRKHPHGDHIKDLATWVDSHFGEDFLANRSLMDVKASRDMGVDHTIVFRDATWKHIEPFLKEFKPHEMLIVNLTTVEKPLEKFLSSYLYLPESTVESVVAAIVEASK